MRKQTTIVVIGSLRVKNTETVHDSNINGSIQTHFLSPRNPSNNSRKQIFRNILDKFSYHEYVCCMCSLESSHQGSSNEYTIAPDKTFFI